MDPQNLSCRRNWTKNHPCCSFHPKKRGFCHPSPFDAIEIEQQFLQQTLLHRSFKKKMQKSGLHSLRRLNFGAPGSSNLCGVKTGLAPHPIVHQTQQKLVNVKFWVRCNVRKHQLVSPSLIGKYNSQHSIGKRKESIVERTTNPVRNLFGTFAQEKTSRFRGRGQPRRKQ